MGSVSAGIEVLRRIVHEPPSEARWAELCACLDGWSGDLDLGLDYAQGRLEGWPDALRVAPSAWIDDALEGRGQPRLELARALDLSPAQWRSEGLGEALKARALSRVTRVDAAGGERFLSGENVTLDEAQCGRLQQASFAEGLTHFGFKHAWLRNRSALTCLAQMRLRSLRLQCMAMSDQEVEALTGSSALAGLERLDLSSNAMDGRGLASIVASTFSQALVSLDFSGNHASPRSIALGRCKLMPALRELTLSGCLMGGTGVRKIARARAFGAVEDLNLNGNRLGSVGIREVAEHTALGRLRRLSICGDGFETPLAFKSLLDSQGLGALETLELRECHLKDQFVRWFTKAEGLPSLRWLDLRDNHISWEGVRAIAGSTGLPALEALRVEGNWFGDPGLIATDPNFYYIFNKVDLRAAVMPEDLRQARMAIHWRGEASESA